MENAFWKNRRVFVTGCTGLLGSWLCDELLKMGAACVGLVRDNVARSNFFQLCLHKKMTIVRGELEDYFLLERLINEYEVEVVFHLGAQTIVRVANSGPLSTFEANIKGTWNILEAARRYPDIGAVIVASSDKAYGEHDKLPYKENAPLQGSHPYDVSKTCADMLAQSYYKTYRLPVCVTRCGNLFGGGDLNFNRLIPGTILSLLHGEPPVIRSDGKYVRDYIYVKDAVLGYLLLAQLMHKKKIAGEAFNLSYELPINVSDIVALISRVAGSNLKPVIKDQVRNEIRDQYLSAGKARRMLGWRPVYNLEGGLKETIGWYKKYFSLE